MLLGRLYQEFLLGTQRWDDFLLDEQVVISQIDGLYPLLEES